MVPKQPVRVVPLDVETFIARWKPSGGSERANYQQFAIELSEVLGVQRLQPAQADGQTDDYRFERPVHFFGGGIPGFIDLYRTGSVEWRPSRASSASPPQTRLRHRS